MRHLQFAGLFAILAIAPAALVDSNTNAPAADTSFPVTITVDAGQYLATIFAMVLLTMAASNWVARRTVHMPITSALAHT